MSVPHPSQWLTIKEAALHQNVSERSIRDAMTKGRKSNSKETVILRSWKTLRGRVTTKAELQRFTDCLNYKPPKPGER